MRTTDSKPVARQYNVGGLIKKHSLLDEGAQHCYSAERSVRRDWAHAAADAAAAAGTRSIRQPLGDQRRQEVSGRMSSETRQHRLVSDNERSLQPRYGQTPSTDRSMRGPQLMTSTRVFVMTIRFRNESERRRRASEMGSKRYTHFVMTSATEWAWACTWKHVDDCVNGLERGYPTHQARWRWHNQLGKLHSAETRL